MLPVNPQLFLAPKLKGLNIEELIVLNLGAGNYTSALAAHIFDFPFKKLISVDIWPKYLDEIDESKIKAKEHIKIVDNILTMDFPDADVVMLFDVAEHMTYNNLDKLLEKIETTIPNLKRILIFGPIERNKYKLRIPEDLSNQYQIHHIRLSPDYFEKRGYQVDILNNFHRWENADGVKPGDALWAIKNK